MITGIVIGLIIGGLTEIMYTLGCIACFGFVVVIIAALLDL